MRRSDHARASDRRYYSQATRRAAAALVRDLNAWCRAVEEFDPQDRARALANAGGALGNLHLPVATAPRLAARVIRRARRCQLTTTTNA